MTAGSLDACYWAALGRRQLKGLAMGLAVWQGRSKQEARPAPATAAVRIASRVALKVMATGCLAVNGIANIDASVRVAPRGQAVAPRHHCPLR